MISVDDIERIRAQIAEKYSQDPIQLIEDARSERNIAESEQGRYILELLQNADDAQLPESSTDSIKTGERKAVFLVTDKYLYCANGGYPLSRDGLNSICRAFLSPKRRDTPVIGFKGVGFKSVLALTEQPEIYWRNGAVFFSRQQTFDFLKTKAPDAVSNLTPDEVPILRCPHIMDFNSAVESDPILKRLLNDSATVFRFPFANELARRNAVARLGEIKSSAILFLNNLSTIEMETGTSSRICKITKEELENDTKNDAEFSVARATISDGTSDSKWVLISGTYRLPFEIKKQLPPTWKETDSVRISYAVPVSTSEKFAPLDDYPFLHVFFPTEERIPFRMLMHGTFRTNVDRRLLTQDDPLNEHMIKKAIQLLKDKALPIISKQVDEPGRIIDFLQPPKDLNAATIEGRIWSELCDVLRNHKFVPGRSKDNLLSPAEVLIAPLTQNAERFKSAVRGELTTSLCYDSIDSNVSRCETLQRLGAKAFEIMELPKFFEDIFVAETEWASTVYAILDDVHSHLKANNPSQRYNFIEEVKKRKLLFLSDGERVSAESIDNEGPIFFPPSGNVPVPPKGLNLRFLDSQVVDQYLKLTSKTIRATFLYHELKVDEYAAVPVISKTIIPAINEFWKKWPHQRIFEPEQVLGFLHSLFGEDLPQDDKVKAISLIPVPIKGEDRYASAYSVYASKEWTGNDDLEFIYGTSSNFLKPLDDTANDEMLKRWGKFYQQLGVSWLPRIIPQFEDFEDDRWVASSWTGIRFSTSPHARLQGWADYCKSISEECERLGDENPLAKYTVCLKTSWCLDKFDQIVTDPQKARKLFSVLARNWDNHYSRFSTCKVAWKDKFKVYYYESDIPSYFYWKLRNYAWLPASRFDLWSFRKPSELFIKTESVYNELGDLVPYIHVEEEDQINLLKRLGLKTSIDEITPEQWWRIATDIPRLLDPDERVVRPMYRKMLQVEDIEKDSVAKDNFMSHGRVLALVGGEWKFVDRNEVWYVESEEFRRLFRDEIAIFAIQHEERKGAAIKRVFDIKVLEDDLHHDVAKGKEDLSASEMLNQFFDTVRPFLVARVHEQRPSREAEDISLVRRLQLAALKSLSVNYRLDLEDEPIARSSEKGTYLDKQNNIIYVDARKFNIGDIQSIETDQKLASELGMQITYYLGVNLASDFMFLINSKDELRYEILARANVSRIDVDHFRESLRPTTVVSPPSVAAGAMIAVSVPQEVPPSLPTGDSPEEHRPEVQIRPLQLWNPSELGFGAIIDTIASANAPRGMNTPGGNSSSRPAYITDQDERKKVDQAGIALVIAFENYRHKKDHACSPKVESREKQNCGYDIISECENEKRQIEVKSSKGDIQVIELTAPEWDAARKAETGNTHFLYRVRYLDKSSGKEPDIIVIRDPYNALMGEPTRFKLRLNRLRGKMQIISLAKLSEPSAVSA